MRSVNLSATLRLEAAEEASRRFELARKLRREGAEQRAQARARSPDLLTMGPSSRRRAMPRRAALDLRARSAGGEGVPAAAGGMEVEGTALQPAVVALTPPLVEPAAAPAEPVCAAERPAAPAERCDKAGAGASRFIGSAPAAPPAGDSDCESDAARPPPAPLLKAQAVYRCGGLTWSSKFDSGNLGAVRRLAADERGGGHEPCEHQYELWTTPDCLGTDHETHNRSWFYFSVRSLPPGAPIRLRVVNLNVQAKLFAGGYTPVWRATSEAAGSDGGWQPVTPGCSYGKAAYGFFIEWSFALPPEAADDTALFFAFAVPYSTTKVERKLQSVTAAFAGSAALREAVYFHRSTLAKSCDGRAVPLLTLTSPDGRSGERDGAALSMDDALYPDPNAGAAADFQKAKRIVFISARVHPAETMAQWMFDGVLDFLLRLDDPRAAALRERFVFKLVPLVNPDGVARGHQRTDTWGQNLNRRYMSPEAEREPSVYAIRSALLDWHSRGRLCFYFDLHAHTSRDNAFFFGNFYDQLEAQVDNVLFAKLVTLNSPHVDFSLCNFSASGMSKEMHDGTSKSGSGRVALHHATTGAAPSAQRVLCYTVEVNPNKGRHRNAKAKATGKGSGRASPPRNASSSGGRYTVDDWAEIGRSTVVSLLDFYGANPWTRIGSTHSDFESLAAVKHWCVQFVAQGQGFRDCKAIHEQREELLMKLRPKKKPRPKKRGKRPKAAAA